MTRTEKAEQRARDKARAEYLRNVAQTAIQTNTCPQCGNGVYVNTTLAGWIQCQGYPDRPYRRAGHENDQKCSWQGFTN